MATLVLLVLGIASSLVEKAESVPVSALSIRIDVHGVMRRQVALRVEKTYPRILLPDAVVEGICKSQPCQVRQQDFACKGIYLVELPGCSRRQGQSACGNMKHCSTCQCS